MPAFTTSDLLCLLPFILLLIAFIFNLYNKWRHLRTTGEMQQPRSLEENTPLDYAIYGFLWAYEHSASIVQKARRGERKQMLAQPGNVAADPLLIVLLNGLHLLVIGPSRSGKTSLVHALAMQWRQTSHVLVCDPDAAPGLWNGCDVFGAGDDFAAIDTALTSLASEITARREQRARGVRRFSPLRIILCEYADIARYCEQARTIIEDCLRRGGKLGISLVLDVQDKQRKTLDLDGATHLLQNFSHICEVRRSPNGIRTATVIANDGEQAEATYDIPALPDLDNLVAQHSVSTNSQLNSTVQKPLDIGFSASQPVPVQHGTSGTESIRTPDTPSMTLPADDEAVAIRYLLQHLGSKNKVAEFLGGSKTTAYKRINRALGEEE